jgi:ABC-2 type transport system permease protein
MANLITFYRRECSAYFNSPIAYILLIAYIMAMSFIFFPIVNFFSSPNPDFRAYFEHPYAFSFYSLVFIPAITMRLWSEERKQGTIEILMTMPVKAWEIVVAKFLAGYTIVVIAALLTLVVPLSISTVLTLDWGAVFTSYLGILLISAVYVAIGACVSALTENQIVAFMIAVMCSALVCFMGFPQVIQWADENVVNGVGTFLGYFGTFFHYQNFAKGLINPVDLVYAVSMTALFLIINNVVVEGRKY